MKRKPFVIASRTEAREYFGPNPSPSCTTSHDPENLAMSTTRRSPGAVSVTSNSSEVELRMVWPSGGAIGDNSGGVESVTASSADATSITDRFGLADAPKYTIPHWPSARPSMR